MMLLFPHLCGCSFLSGSLSLTLFSTPPGRGCRQLHSGLMGKWPRRHDHRPVSPCADNKRGMDDFGYYDISEDVFNLQYEDKDETTATATATATATGPTAGDGDHGGGIHPPHSGATAAVYGPHTRPAPAVQPLLPPPVDAGQSSPSSGSGSSSDSVNDDDTDGGTGGGSLEHGAQPQFPCFVNARRNFVPRSQHDVLTTAAAAAAWDGDGEHDWSDQAASCNPAATTGISRKRIRIARLIQVDDNNDGEGDAPQRTIRVRRKDRPPRPRQQAQQQHGDPHKDRGLSHTLFADSGGGGGGGGRSSTKSRHKMRREGFYRKVLVASAEPVLIPLHTHARFTSAEEYYHTWGSFAVVEARAIIAQGKERVARSRSGGAVTVMLRVEEAAVAIGGGLFEISMVAVLPVQGRRAPELKARQCQPGNIYSLRTGDRSGGPAVDRPAVLHSASRDNRKWRLYAGFELEEGDTVPAIHLESVLSCERMATVCAESPKPEFLFRLLGDNPSTHIKFASSSSEDENDSNGVDGTGTTGAPAAATVAEIGELGSLNGPQAAALERCVAAAGKRGGFELVQGPPGCGKTHFLAVLVDTLTKPHSKRQRGAGLPSTAPCRIMVCAPSNKGLVVAMTAFLARQRATGGDASCCLVGVEDSLTEAGDAQTVRDHFVYCFVEETVDNIARALACVGMITDDEMAAAGLSFADHCSPWPGDPPAGTPDRNASMYRARLVALLGALKRANTRLERSAPKFVQQQRLGTPLKQALHAAADLAHYLGIADPKQPGAAAAKAASHRAVREAVETLLGAIRDAGKAAGSAVHLEVLNSAQVVFVTLTSSGSSLLRWMARVDVLVVDEAAQALEAEFLITLPAKPAACVFIGDPNQLPATIHSAAARDLGYGRSLMERLMYTAKQDFSLLSIQYRMHPDISAFPAARFYRRQLLNAPLVTTRPGLGIVFAGRGGGGGWSGQPYAFVDVAGSEQVTSSRSTCNLAEVAAVVQVLEKLAAARTTGPGSAADARAPRERFDIARRVAVITFYQAQRTALAAAIRRRFPGAGNAPAVHTVDSFQGSEADVVVVSFVRSNGGGNVGFLRASQRLVVALTRARHALLLVGNVGSLGKSTPDLTALVADAKARNVVLDRV